MKIFFVINPISGGQSKYSFRNFLKAYCREKGLSYFIYNTTGEGDIDRIREIALSFSPDRVAVVGGDGTLLMAAIALKNLHFPVGLIPMGSANGMAVELQIPPHPVQALQYFLRISEPKPMDLIQLNDQYYCLHISDIGLNARLVSQFDQDENRGLTTYAKYALSTLSQAEPLEFILDIDGVQKKRQGYMVAIANATKYGTGMVLNPNGSPFDGKFEICIVKEVTPPTLLMAAASLFYSDIGNNKYIEVFSCKNATIQVDHPEQFQCDGEVIGKVEKIVAKILPGALPLLVEI